MTERRQFYRWSFSIPCSFKWENGSGRGEVANISCGGLCIQKASSIPAKGTTLQVILQLGHQYACELEACVIYTGPCRVEDSTFGVEFTESPRASQRHALMRIIETISNDGPEKTRQAFDAER